MHARSISDLVGKIEKRTRKPSITQEMISKMSDRKKWKNVNNEEGRRNNRRLRNALETQKRPKRNTLRTYEIKL